MYCQRCNTLMTKMSTKMIWRCPQCQWTSPYLGYIPVCTKPKRIKRTDAIESSFRDDIEGADAVIEIKTDVRYVPLNIAF